MISIEVRQVVLILLSLRYNGQRRCPVGRLKAADFGNVVITTTQKHAHEAPLHKPGEGKDGACARYAEAATFSAAVIACVHRHATLIAAPALRSATDWRACCVTVNRGGDAEVF